MKTVWHDYPLNVFSAAISTILGGLLTLTISLNVGTAVALWVLEGEFPELLWFLVCGAAPIGVACIMMWGYVYVLLLAWVLHRLVFQEASRRLTAIYMTPLHFVFTILAFNVGFNEWRYFDAKLILRAIVGLVVLMTPLAAMLVASHFKKKRESNRSLSSEGDISAWAETTRTKVDCDFRLLAVEADTNHGAMGCFAFRHREAQPIQLCGSGFTGANLFRVRLEKFQREDGGRWSTVEAGDGGTGAQLYPIEPDTDYVFLIPLWLFLEKGQKGLVEIHGANVTAESAVFDTAAIRKIGEERKRAAKQPYGCT